MRLYVRKSLADNGESPESAEEEAILLEPIGLRRLRRRKLDREKDVKSNGRGKRKYMGRLLEAIYCREIKCIKDTTNTHVQRGYLG